MRINQLNSYNIARNLEKTSVMQASSQAKLAAAKQILGAGDDPAGMAISNNIKAQLGGLNMAARNTQDALSMLKTADGAGQQVHNLLNRMNELAVSSANGLLSASDRSLISGEFNQLKSEIDSIAGTTTFNDMKIIDGSLNSLNEMRTAQSAGISVNTYYEDSETSVENSISEDYTDVSQGSPATFDVSFGDYSVTGAQDGDILSVSIGDQTIDLTLSAGDYSASDIASIVTEQINSADAQSIEIDGNAYTASSFGNTINFTYDNGGSAANNIAIDSGSLASISINTSYAPAGETAAASVSGSYSQSPVSISGGEAYSGEPVQINTARISGSLKTGDVFSMGGKRFEFVVPGQTPSSLDASPISIFEAASNAQILQAARDAMAASVGRSLNITAKSNSLQISQKVAGKGDVSIKMTPAQNKSSMVNFSPSKLRAGDQITLNITNNRGNTRQVTYTHAEGNTMNDIAKSLGGSRIGNSLNFSGQSVSVDFKAGKTAAGAAAQIQTGANEGDTKKLDIGSLSTTNLDLSDISIDTPDKARSAITAIQNALGKVSQQRGTMGAMQNRMESTLNNLNVSIENQTAAQSRIEDLDVAKGAMQNMLAKIQQQAQSSIMAQSNLNAGNILSLLV